MTERTRTRWYSDWRNDLAAAGFEFFGTCMFLIMSLGTAQSLSVMNNVRPSSRALTRMTP
ncbi:hypothetical protein BKA62DRAFT_770136 [Auriculariales sp. MPI-PUGE-AT-0066]|nr:hypothetical protein BKA62DRAFT_770136 [Auriculariales sp. MPI-PUGE-AT-0066]